MPLDNKEYIIDTPLKDPIFIHPTADADRMCENVQSVLETFWKTPKRLAMQSVGLVNHHLETCEKCQQAFLAVQQASPNPPQWQQDPCKVQGLFFFSIANEWQP